MWRWVVLIECLGTALCLLQDWIEESWLPRFMAPKMAQKMGAEMEKETSEKGVQLKSVSKHADEEAQYLKETYDLVLD